jgi:hypothetical protein
MTGREEKTSKEKKWSLRHVKTLIIILLVGVIKNILIRWIQRY